MDEFSPPVMKFRIFFLLLLLLLLLLLSPLVGFDPLLLLLSVLAEFFVDVGGRDSVSSTHSWVADASTPTAEVISELSASADSPTLSSTLSFASAVVVGEVVREMEETLFGETKSGLGVKQNSTPSGADERFGAEEEEDVEVDDDVEEVEGIEAGKTLEDRKRLLKGRE